MDIILHGVAQNKPDRRNKKEMVHFNKNFTSGYFLTVPSPIPTHFLNRSFHHRNATMKSSLAMTLMTPSQVF
jgi:hypothetical protein